MNKKGMEMSINVVVGIILGLLMLGAGITIFFQIYDKSQQASLDVDEAIREKLLLSFDEGEILFVPETDVTVSGSDPASFYFGIYNILDVKKEFSVIITSEDIDQTKLLYLETNPNILAKDRRIFKLVVETEGLERGQHSILIDVKHDDIAYAKRIVRVNVK